MSPNPEHLISYSLFGLQQTYWNIIPAVIRSHLCIFPGWKMRFHVDNAASRHPYYEALQTLEQMDRAQLVLVTREAPPLALGMLWRLLPIYDPATRIVLCRDVDSIHTARDRWAVEEFINSSDYIAHTIRDHPLHSVPMLGGLIGFRAESIRQTTELNNYDAVTRFCTHMNQPGMDQFVLALRIWPIVRERALEHCLNGAPSFGAQRTITVLDPKEPLADLSPVLAVQSNTFSRFIGDRCKSPAAAIDFFGRHVNITDWDRFLESERQACLNWNAWNG